MEEFDNYFQVRKNVIFERARFNKRNQLSDEAVEEFIAEIHRLADRCDFKKMKDELIRDHLVVGIRDNALSERLQMEPELTLNKAKRLIRQREAVKEQQETLRKPNKGEGALDYVVRQAPRRKLPVIPAGATMQQNVRLCRCCGKDSHPRHLCPAKEALCFRCNRKGHFSGQCLSNTVAGNTRSLQEMTSEAHGPTTNVAYLDTLDGPSNVWEIDVNVRDKTVTFKVDTGAEVTALSDTTWISLGIATPLKNSELSLFGPDQTPLNLLGKTSLTMSYKGKTSTQDVFIVKGLKNNLLGLPTIRELNLIQSVCAIENNIISQYPSLFTGLGTFAQEYEIKLKPNSQPFSLSAPRNISIPLRSKVQTELERMESLEVISPVEEPTPWCAAMVVVPKDSGAVRICVDLKPLNERVLREVHPMLKVDTTLALLSGAKVFSKFDANSGFWQIPLANKSKLLTTFITPYGRFCFNKLPFGISSAPEIFQRHMSEVLSGLPGVLCHVDDVLVFGKDRIEYDTRLQVTLKRLQTAGITLNEGKCQFYQSCITFLGHVIHSNGISPDPKKTAAIQNMKPPSSVSELRRFMGMANQMSKFSPNIAHISKPLRELLSSKVAWTWSTVHTDAFKALQDEISSPRVLALYNTEANTKISADASAYGLGAVLLQQQHNDWRPVAFASRA